MPILEAVLSKVETLIDWAKFGVSMHRLHKGNSGAIYLCNRVGNIGWNNGVTTKTLAEVATVLNAPYLTAIYGNDVLGGNQQLTKVYLPKCTSISNAQRMFAGAKALKEIDLSSLRAIPSYVFQNCTALEILKLGAIETFGNVALVGCTALHTLEVGENTACNLPFKYCPNLTQDCVHKIIDNVANRKGTSSFILEVHQDVYDRISEEYKTKLSNKNWSLAIGS